MITINNKKIKWYNGITIHEILKKINNGNYFAVVNLNGKLISKPNFFKTEVSDNSNILTLPLIAGG
jgi:thiamine biosynthesis protein ThiS